MNARDFRWNPFNSKAKTTKSQPDLNAEETTMKDNVHPLNENADMHNQKPNAEETLRAAADAAASAAAEGADTVKGAAEEIHAAVAKPGFFATRTGRIVKGAAIVAGGGLIAAGGFIAYKALNAVSGGAVGEAVSEAADATGEAVAEAAEEVVAAIFGR